MSASTHLDDVAFKDTEDFDRPSDIAQSDGPELHDDSVSDPRILEIVERMRNYQPPSIRTLEGPKRNPDGSM